MLKKILIIIIFFVEINSLRMWTFCQEFADKFRISSFDIILKLKEAINNDIGYSTSLVRFFHNKIALSLDQLLTKYFHFWDISFGVLLFSVVGYFGIICGFWYLVKTKSKFKWIVFAFLLILPLIEIFKLSNQFQIRFMLLTVPYILLSSFGFWHFMKANGKKRIIMIVLLILISIWYQFVLQNDIFLNCIKE